MVTMETTTVMRAQPLVTTMRIGAVSAVLIDILTGNI